MAEVGLMPTEITYLVPEQGRHVGQCWPTLHRPYYQVSVRPVCTNIPLHHLTALQTNLPYDPYQAVGLHAPISLYAM